MCCQPVLHPPFGRDLQAGDALAQSLDIEVGIGLELTAQPPQRGHCGAIDRGDGSLGGGQFGRGEPPTLARAEPEAEEDQIDVAGRTVLERDQRAGNARPGIKGEREPPKRLAGRGVFTLHITHYRRPIKPARFRAISRFVLYGDKRRRCGCCHFVILREQRALAMDLNVEALKAKLAALKTEHRDLDDVIARIADQRPFDQLQLQRLKKRKLSLKDQISKIESELLPDIIA